MAMPNSKPRHYRAADQLETARALRAKGANLRQIARALGRSHRAVTALLAQLGPAQEDSEETGEQDRRAQAHRRAVLQHLNDIRREHGFDKRWESYALRPGTALPLDSWRSLDFSPIGSPAEMCAGLLEH
ncbi:hypothetical protein FZC33_18685 [Labrys sp. KNU-23]|uniref:hypothetical protein n=1 Tax=Labrys sp. KNU-23 TaxID=2789216 RepID=UPI0011ED8ABC|nr:hypothetical protein [Labrys sp. KNU-23]QEN88204.1 hypothetical protein FZC33_18685 [Labrys sp. KNU-23]